jgi:hypothetical protein
MVRAAASPIVLAGFGRGHLDQRRYGLPAPLSALIARQRDKGHEQRLASLRLLDAPADEGSDTRVTRAFGLDVVAELIKAGVQRFAERRAAKTGLRRVGAARGRCKTRRSVGQLLATRITLTARRSSSESLAS